jgi:GNAT superfamily N-acetyltransferase
MRPLTRAPSWRIFTPDTVEQLDQVRALMRAFVAWHRERHAQDAHLIDAYFDAGAFEDELATLPGEYAAPDGALLLAYDEGAAAGCVALRRLDAAACEMKRMFVYPQFHGRGLGRALGEAIVREGRNAGYSLMRLDTSVRQVEAKQLYAKLGFRTIDPYYDLPPDLRNWLVFMELALQPR